MSSYPDEDPWQGEPKKPRSWLPGPPPCQVIMPSFYESAHTHCTPNPVKIGVGRAMLIQNGTRRGDPYPTP
jgi:hypothetical protein